MNLEVITENLPLYLSGAVATFELLLISLALGLTFAIPLAVLRALPNPWLSRPIWLYTYVFRGTPMLVQLFLIYYGLAQFEWMQQSALWPYFSSAWFCACLTFALNTCAYTVEIIAGSIKSLPAGEIEAAKALGMSRWVMLRRIVLPSALRRALPAYSNEAIFMLHGTSLASIVTVMDLTGAARQVNSTYYLPFEAFITAAVFYFLLTLTLVGLFHAAERRWLRPLMPR
ncbi:ABC transporter permease [Roseateles sp. DAIF2]|uniref:ABC transporter permease n=1 Tax=Roseateles sp. DAIF2 TaxID=2714952 RepID=UPI0018A2503F|nr:ABC transporter permease [Roseateles sp. DAIF2]QPF73644.1 ABC transporter permease [Roseateles sp. DAIF2]